MSNTYPIINNPLLQDATVASQAVGVIQQTLGSLMSYTPTEVNTFLDWSYDAGDIVTLVKDGVSYSMPIFTNYLNWNGAHDVTWVNSGNEERELPNVQERRSYGYGSTVAAVDQKVDENETEFHTYVEQTDEYISLIATETEVATARTLGESLFKITSDGISMLTEKVGSVPDGNNLYSLYQQDAEKIALVVGTSQSGNYIKAAEIVTQINAQTGQGQVLISADQITLNGNTKIAGTVTIDGTSYYGLVVDAISAGAAEVTSLVATDLDVMDTFTMDDGTTCIFYNTPTFDNGMTVYEGITFNTYTLSESDFPNVVKNASVSGNVLTLTKLDGTTINFSKATVLTPSWGSGANSGVFTVVATQNGVEVGRTSTSPTIGQGVWYNGSIPVYINADGGVRVTGSVSIPDTVSFSGTETSKGVFQITCSIGGTTRTGTCNINADYSYTDGETSGFDICHDSIALSETSQTLSSGESVTIYPKAKASKSASSASNITSKGITITAPTFSTETKSDTITSNGTYTYTPSSGNDGLSQVTITVNVSGGGGGGGSNYRVRMRDAPNGSFIMYIEQGTTVNSSEDPSNYIYEWFPLKYSGSVGYVMAKYISGTLAYQSSDGEGYRYKGSASVPSPSAMEWYEETAVIEASRHGTPY